MSFDEIDPFIEALDLPDPLRATNCEYASRIRIFVDGVEYIYVVEASRRMGYIKHLPYRGFTKAITLDKVRQNFPGVTSIKPKGWLDDEEPTIIYGKVTYRYKIPDSWGDDEDE